MGTRANNPNADFLIDLVRVALLNTELPPIPEGCTPGAVAKLISDQHLTNLVYPTIMKEPQLRAVMLLLQKEYLVQIPKISNQDAEIQRWLDAAEEKGLDCIPMKGYLLRKLYPSPLMRSMTDFDVLIRNMDAAALRPWMEAMGYVGEEEKEISHHHNYTKAPWMYMELHKHITKPLPGRDELEAKIWAHCTPEPGKKHIFRMSDEDFYLFHLLHMYKHFIKQGCGLKSVIDIHVFLKAYGSDLDRGYLEQGLKELGIDGFARYMERLSRILLGDEEADEDSRAVTDYLANYGVFGTAEQHRVIEVSRGKSGNRAVNKFTFTLKRIFPGVKMMSKRFPSVLKFPFLLPFYWVANFFRAIFLRKRKLSDLTLTDISEEEYNQVNKIFTITDTKLP